MGRLRRRLLDRLLLAVRWGWPGLAACGGARTARGRLGRRAERDAARLLKRDGYAILEHGFRCREGEIDLVAFKEGVVAFVEVRSRAEPSALDPLETVTRAKRGRLVRAAHRYAALHGLWREEVGMRFDVVALRYGPDGSLAGAQHIQDAFRP